LTDHPDHEQLAAFQAGDGDRRQRADVEAHLAGCPTCAEMVALVERARSGLAMLQEPDLPPGLHDRLAGALEAEAGVPGRAGVERRRERAVPWYRRPVAWGAAAALLLAALVALPLLDRSTELSTAGGGGGGQTASEADTATAAGTDTLPVFRIPGEVSAAAIRARLATDSRARAALEGTPLGPSGAPSAAPVEPPLGAGSTTEGLRSGTSAPPTGSASVPACLVAATAAADPAIRPLTPVFFVEGTYRGRQATVLVTTSTAQPGRADLWVFPHNDCSGAPVATERVR